MHAVMPIINYLHDITAVAFIVSCGAMLLLVQGCQPPSKQRLLFLVSAARSLSLMAICSLIISLAAGTVRVFSGITEETIEGLVLLPPVCAGLFFWFRAGRMMRRIKAKK
jgi:hypothetical protein